MRPFLALAVAAPALFLPALIAQGVTATATAVNVNGIIQVGTGAPAVQQVAAGTPIAGSMVNLVSSSSLEFALAIMNANLRTSSAGVELTLTETVIARGQASSFLQGDVLLDVSVPQPMRARVELELGNNIVAGTPVPAVSVDIGNDGSINMWGAPNRSAFAYMTLGANSSILLRSSGAAAGASGQQQSNMQISLRVIRDSPNISVLPVLAACDDGQQLYAEETFAPGLQLRTNMPPPALTFLVVGFSTSFAPVPGFANCFLVPSQDLVITMPAAPVTIAAGLAPLEFYAQSLAISNLVPSVVRLHVSNSVLVRML